MTKNDIIIEVSKNTGFTNVEVELMLDNIINSIKMTPIINHLIDLSVFMTSLPAENLWYIFASPKTSKNGGKQKFNISIKE